MIRRCDDRDFEVIWAIINDGAQAYEGVIPADCWTGPYMSREKLRHEMDEGVVFWGYEDGGTVIGVMGNSTRPGSYADSARVCSHCEPEARDRGAIAGAFAGDGERCGVDRDMGGCGVGDSLLREARVSAGWFCGEGSAAEAVLEHTGTSGKNVGGDGGCEVARRSALMWVGEWLVLQNQI
jgi:hypothetical protein